MAVQDMQVSIGVSNFQTKQNQKRDMQRDSSAI